jgi:hypothetical protein
MGRGGRLPCRSLRMLIASLLLPDVECRGPDWTLFTAAGSPFQLPVFIHDHKSFKIVETDGGYFGGYVKPANYKENRRDRRLAKNQNGKRQVDVVVREREGRTLPAVFKSESAALGWIASRIAKGTEIVADEAGSSNDLQGRFARQRIDHQAAYSDRGVYSNGAKSFFSRMRRAEIGPHHHVAGPYLVRYAQEAP